MDHSAVALYPGRPYTSETSTSLIATALIQKQKGCPESYALLAYSPVFDLHIEGYELDDGIYSTYAPTYVLYLLILDS